MSLSSENTSAPPTFYDVQAVARMFNMSRMTVYRAIQSGELPAVRIRGRWLVPARVIEALVAKAEAAVATRPAVAIPDWMPEAHHWAQSDSVADLAPVAGAQRKEG